MDIVNAVAPLRQKIEAARRAGRRIVFVPTMGNLHAGHLQLMALARQHGDYVVASIFVNRLQFGPNEDFDRYPRTFQADTDALRQVAVDLLFAPDEQVIYPAPQQYRVQPMPLAEQLEGAFRPGFFNGVCTVVLKLFNMVQPDAAVFGCKDRQQLHLIKAMVEQFALPIDLIASPTARASDGLALSSRNGYLSPEERLEAPRLYRCLVAIADAIQQGNHDFTQLEQQAGDDLNRHGWVVDYVAVRQGGDLESPLIRQKNAGVVTASTTSGYVILAAARLGRTRLIDNIDVFASA